MDGSSGGEAVPAQQFAGQRSQHACIDLKPARRSKAASRQSGGCCGQFTMKEQLYVSERT